jgi:hypothetical protein
VIGCYYQGGILYYLLQEGDPGYSKDTLHGLIAANAQFDERLPWGCGGMIGAVGTEIGDGEKNTKYIVENCADTGIAAKLCYNLNLNGFDDWFLPSFKELGKFVNFISNNGNSFRNSFLWTSTSDGGEYATLLHLYNRFIYNHLTSPEFVLPIRSF